MTDKGIIRQALREDSAAQDITTRALVPPHARASAVIIAKEDMCVCGLELVQGVYAALDKKVRCTTLVKDGAEVSRGRKLIALKGPARSILSGERVALNFLGHLSGVATLTRRYVRRIQGARAEIYDTRKTTPGLRELEKYAVRCGGGHNHRTDLASMALIKDNHRMVMRRTAIEEVVKKIKSRTRKTVMVEVDTVAQFKRALKSGADVILVDNMKPSYVRSCLKLRNAQKRKTPLIEASGGITLDNVAHYAATGIERISIGALTHSAASADVSLELT